MYYGIGDQIILVTTEAGAVFIHDMTGTLYFYHEEVEGFGDAYGDVFGVLVGGDPTCGRSSRPSAATYQFLDLPGRCTQPGMVSQCSNGTDGSIGASYASFRVATRARTQPPDAGS